MWISILALGGLLGSGVLIGVSLGLTGLLLLYFFGGNIAPAVNSTWVMMFNFALVAIPLYIFLGEVFVHSGLSQRVYGSLTDLLERFPGGLLLTNTAVCAIFGAISGSSMATAAAVGSVAYPELSRKGYNRQVLVGNLAGSGTLGLLVPPSFTLIVYGAWQEVSVGDLFIAAVVPAILLTSLFLIFIMVLCSVRRDIVPATKEIVPLWPAILKTRDIWPMVILIFCVLGTIYLGMATPTEAAGLGAAAAIALSICFRSFSFRKLYDALMATVRIMCMIGMILIGATIFTSGVATLGIPRQIIMAISDANLSPIMMTIAIYVLYLILGCFFEALSMLIITLPFTFPLMIGIGWDPLWFGVVLVILTEMGQLTPPVGVNLYVLQGVTLGEVSLGEVAIGAIPYFLMQGLVLCLITIVPQLCTWLPRYITY